MNEATVYGDLEPHPTATGWAMGWAVLSSTRKDFHLAAVCKERPEADKLASELGGAYKAVWGSLRTGTDQFYHHAEVNCCSLPLLA